LFARGGGAGTRLMPRPPPPGRPPALVPPPPATPPVAARLGLDPFYFVNRHVMFLAPAFLVLIATSFLPPRHIRRVALVVFAVSLVLVAATLWYGAEVKGARRWITLVGISVQPSEFLKPSFV